MIILGRFSSVEEAWDFVLQSNERCPEAEELIKQDPYYAYYYAYDIIKGRWLECEPYLFQDEEGWKRYLSLLNAIYTSEDVLLWISEGISDITLDIINHLDTSLELQEKIVQLRPDIINKINNLDPELKEKYQHEVSLAGLEI